MAKTYKIGTRASTLALKQVEEVLNTLRKYYPAIKVEIVGIDTYGDKDRRTPISEIEGSDFFTREIDEALLRGEIDGSTSSLNFARDDPERVKRVEGPLTINPVRSRRIDFAVHSAKDLPDELRDGLIVVAITESIDPYDALVSKSKLELDELPYGAAIGTSSLRRKAQLKRYRSDFQIVDIRGNIEERLKLLDETDLDAIVIAAASLLRLGKDFRIAQRIPFEILKPHPLQGRLAIVVKKEDLELIDLLSVIDSREHVLP